jgi:hypothetical protein
MKVTGSTGTSPGVGSLCGNNTGQHLYLPISGGMAGASVRYRNREAAIIPAPAMQHQLGRVCASFR